MVMKLQLGYNASGHPIHLNGDDRRIHTHIIGSSGSGKSKFMEWMMRGELRNRQGFCLLDPHGTLYEAVADYCAHHVLKREIILLNLSRAESIIGFSPFRKAKEADVSVQVDRRIAATLHAWNEGTADHTPTLERVLRLIYTVMLEHNLGLAQAAHLIDFNAGNIRKPLIDALATPLIQKEWRELERLKAKEWRDELVSTKNRLFRFLTSQSLTRFMGLPERSIDPSEIMEQGKILLVNLAPSDHLSQENARVFGSLLINEFFECALRRRKQANGSDPKPYYLYIDEFQNFVSLDIAEMLDQVRKFGLFLVLAHQRFGHLDEDLMDAVLTNCQIKAVFGGLPVESAKLMAEELFIGKLDPMRIKAAIYQTKFWPEYRRDRVYTSGNTHSSGSSTGESSGAGSGINTSSGQFFEPGNWFAGPMSSVGTSAGKARSSFSFSGSGRSTSDTFGEMDSVADIPIFVPVPFQELSSIQYYTIDEQLLELTAGLKEQFERHCFIKIRQQDTQPMLVPFVESFYTSEKNVGWYLNKLFRDHGALQPPEIDFLIEARETALLKAAAPKSDSEPMPPPIVKRAPRRGSARDSLFSTINSDANTNPPEEIQS